MDEIGDSEQTKNDILDNISCVPNYQQFMLQISVVDTCAADRSYAVLIESEAAADCLLTHVFVELITTSEVQ